MATQADRTLKVEGREGAGDRVSFHATNRLDVMPLSAWLPSHSYPIHTHDAFGIGYMVAGVQDSVYGRKSRITEAGDLMLTNPGELHDGVPIDDEGRAFNMFYLQPEILYQAAADLGATWSENTEIAPSAVTDRELVRLLHALHASYRAGGDKLSTDSVLAELSAKLVLRHGTEKVVPPSVEQTGVERVRQMLSDQPEESYTLDGLAAVAGLSKYHFLRSFKKICGVPPFAYLTHRRISKALTLLCTGESAAQAAVAAGFYDQSHFTRYFKQIYGVAPGAAARSAGLY